ncbi:MAG: hypothetical protein ACE5GO_07520 [Anaerolineales bacterium]
MKTNPRKFIHAYRQAPWRVQLQMTGLFLLSLVMIGLVAGIYLNVTARASTIGREIQEMQNGILILQRANSDLETQLAQLTSASTMERRARDLGFRPVNPGEALYLMVPGYTGRQAVVLAPPPGPAVSSSPGLPPEFTQTLFDWLKEFALQPDELQQPGWLPQLSWPPGDEPAGGGPP